MLGTNFRKDITGLRAVAVIAVVLYHSEYLNISSGFLGVDVFFVISGYLITDKIISEINAGTFRFSVFYIKRARRILPALYLGLIFSTLVLIIFYFPEDVEDFKRSMFYTLIFSSNVYFWNNINYFSPQIETRLLAHTWSLGIEEQFYFFLPLGLVIVYKLFKKDKHIEFLIFSAIILSFLITISDIFFIPVTKFYLLPTRLWEFLLGSLCSLVLTKNVFKKNKNVSDISFLLLILSFFIFNKYDIHPGYITLLPTVATLIMIIFNEPSSIANRILENKTVQTIGLASYSIYILHYPIFSIDSYWLLANFFGTFQWLIDFVLIICSVCIGILAWKFVETPSRDETKFNNPKLVVSLIITSILILFVSTSSILNNFIEKPFLETNFAIKSQPGNLNEICLITENIVIDPLNCIKDYGLEKNNYLVIGDSVAENLYWGIKDSLKESESVSLMAVTGCIPLVTEYPEKLNNFESQKCTSNYLQINNIINSLDFEKIIIVYNYQEFKKFDYELEIFENSANYFFETLNSFQYDDFIITGQPVVWKENLKNIIFKEIKLGNKNFDIKDSKYLIDNLFEYEESYKSLTNLFRYDYFSIIEFFCESGECARLSYENGKIQLFFEDAIHLSSFSSDNIAKEIIKYMENN
jgi:peptidoglycan/LPS O-acetylase OafA/YrhL